MIRSFVAVTAVAGVSAIAAAAPLNLTEGRPDIFSGGISISYNAGTKQLHAAGLTQQLTLNFVDPSVNLGNVRAFDLTATVNNDGTITGVGSLNIFGDYFGTNVLLMSANHLDQFGYSFGLLEFVYSGGSGSLNPAHVNTGVILSDFTQSFSGFGSSFSNFGVASSDSYLIPSPSGAALGLMGLGLAFRRRR